jgi:transposase, IS30 family
VVPGKHLSVQQRAMIGALAGARDGWGRPLSCRVIAAQVGTSHPTVSRELRRDGKTRATYRAWSAQLDADVRRRRPKPFKLDLDPVLRRFVARGLARRWSPQQISGRLVEAFPPGHPRAGRMRVSHTTIYHSIYVLGRPKLRAELDAQLRRRGQIRRPRAESHGYERIKDAVPIAARPPEADDRRVPGHWEGDLIKGRRNASAIATLVERTTRFTILVPLPNGWKAHLVAEALAGAVQDLPAHLRRSLTWDRGTEMAAHAQFSVATGIEVYFADPHSPWQRASNENTNGLLRDYLPKGPNGTDLNTVSAARYRQIQDELNGRPRQILGFKTPTEALTTLITTAQQADGATTP